MRYAGVCVTLMFVGGACVAVGGGSLGILLFPLPAAYYCTRQWQRGAGVVAAAGAAALLGGGGWMAAAGFMAAAGIGLALGILCTWHWRFHAAVLVSAIMLWALASVNAATNWEQLRKELASELQKRVTTIEEAAKAAGEDTPVALKDIQQWTEAHLGDLYFGGVFGTMLFATAGATAFLQRILVMRRIHARLRGGFATMRPPDWLVWGAIAAGLACIALQYWPNAVLRAVSWNTAIGLAAIYMLNGLSMLVYALNAFRATPMLMYLTLMAALFVLLYTFPVLVIVGFFDTWLDLRKGLDRLVARMANGPGDDAE